MTAFFTDTETVMMLGRSRQAKRPERPGRPNPAAGEVEQAVVRMKLAGVGRPRRAIGLEKLPGISNYFIGNDPARWRTDVPHFARIEYEGVYPGIDLVWYGNQRRLEYDFMVAPGADPKQIQVAYEGVEALSVEAGGDLVLRTALGEVRQQKPRVYQEVGGKKLEVGARYAIVAGNRVRFELATYDRKRELRIDPVVLVYSTYLGGSGSDYGQGIAVDSSGSAYVTGYTTSNNFPTQSAYQATYQGGIYDAFVTKLADPFRIGTYAAGRWRLDVDGNGTFDAGTDRDFFLGWPGATIVTGDWNGDGKTKVGVYSNGFWFLDYNGDYVWDGGVVDKQVGWGWAGVTPIVGDWNGDGRTKIGVYAGGYWYLDYDGNYLWEYPAKDKIWALGWPGTTPVMGDWNGDGKTKAGAFINGYWYLDYNGNGAWDGSGTDRIYAFGSPGDVPVVGRW